MQAPDLQAEALSKLVRQARKGGRLTQGLMAVRSFQALIATCTSEDRHGIPALPRCNMSNT